MVLLTSSQVNVAISSGIVVLCTTALFLSGYAIQQRTVRHLRAAIRPDNTPQLYLPDRFHDDTTELEDGTIVMLDEYNRPVRMKNGRISIGQGEPVVPPVQVATEAVASEDANGNEVVIEINETLPEILRDEELSVGEEEPQQEQEFMSAEEVGEDVEEPAQQQQQPPTEEGQEKMQQPEVEPERQGEPWEVRGEAQEDLVPNPNDEKQKPISRAERRRLIKEEIQRLSQGEQPVYYQRRLW